MSPHKKKTIYQILVNSGIVKSRKEALALIKKQKVTVNDKIITHLHYQSDPKREKIRVDNKNITIVKKRYFVLNKPRGLITTKENILTLLSKNMNINENEIKSYSPVGRLDKNTTGIIIITNDGDLAYKVLHPDKNVEKSYEVLINGILDKSKVDKLESGVEIELEENGVITKYKTMPSKIEIIDKDKDKENTKLIITIREGKKRQVKRMFESQNQKVLSLRRIKIGNLDARKLNFGKFRELTKEEIYHFVFG